MREKGLRLFCLFFIIIFVGLGIWQYHRYHYKQMLFSAFHHYQDINPVFFSESTLHPFERVRVRGRYLNNMTMLLQNRYHNGQLGVEVLTPIEIEKDSRLLIVDRGWTAHPPLFSQKEKKEGTKEEIVGFVYPFHEYQFILGDNVLSTSPFIQIQRVDFGDVERVTHHDFYPVVLRLMTNQPHGWVREWIISTISPARHLGYAIQWWLMALVLFFIMIYRGMKYD